MSSTTHIHFSSRRSIMHYAGTKPMGGLENYMLTLCEHLDREAFKVTIVCATEDKQEILQRTSAMNIQVHELETPSEDKQLFMYLKRLIALTCLLRREQVDVLHLHSMSYTGINAIIAAVLARVPVIIETHHQGAIAEPSTIMEKIVLFLKRRFITKFIALYKAQAESLESIGVPLDRVMVVPSGIDVPKFDLDKATVVGASSDRAVVASSGTNTAPFDLDKATVVHEPSIFRLGMVTRIAEGKGHKELLSAVAELVKQYPQLRVTMIGDGPLRSAVEKQIRELGLENVIKLTGWVPNNHVPLLLRDTHAIVLPSYFWGEAFPVTLMEGMAMGLPAIGTRWAGIPDLIIDGETGLLIEPGNVLDLVRAIEQLIANPALAVAMGRRAKERVHRLFDARILGQTMNTLYGQCLNGN
jgi:glycosyltransferase involved in cell wall biosynthesis